MNSEMVDRFWAKIDKTGGADSCWLWTDAPTVHGYGHMWIEGKHRRAHRVAWELANGPIPEGEGHHGTCVCHRCDVRRCVNPAHLFLGTHAENIADRNAKGRSAGAKGETHGRAKLTAAQVVEIRAASGPQTAIAARFGISQSQVGRIRRGKLWTALLKQQQTTEATP